MPKPITINGRNFTDEEFAVLLGWSPDASPVAVRERAAQVARGLGLGSVISRIEPAVYETGIATANLDEVEVVEACSGCGHMHFLPARVGIGGRYEACPLKSEGCACPMED